MLLQLEKNTEKQLSWWCWLIGNVFALKSSYVLQKILVPAFFTWDIKKKIASILYKSNHSLLSGTWILVWTKHSQPGDFEMSPSPELFEYQRDSRTVKFHTCYRSVKVWAHYEYLSIIFRPRLWDTHELWILCLDLRRAPRLFIWADLNVGEGLVSKIWNTSGLKTRAPQSLSLNKCLNGRNCVDIGW